MDELLAEFISETQETLEALTGEVVAWEAAPEDRDRLDAIFRFFHTVKGSCGFLNLPRFEKLSHAAEDVLSEIRDGKRLPDPVTVNAVLAVMDRIGELTEAVASGLPLPMENDELLIAGLSEVDPEAPMCEVKVEAGASRNSQHSVQRTIRLPLSLIDQLMNGVSDMVLARNELSRKLRDRSADPDLDSAFERLSTCVADMRDAISKTRMQRVERLFAAIPRMVRDLGRELGKRIDLTLEGGDVEMDREMVEMVVDPLIHIVRNSIDHGIEAPDQRRDAGKAEAGSLRLCARQSGNQIVIEVVDDGRGIDTARLIEKALAGGVIDKDRVSRMDEAQKLDLIFTPGLTTANAVTAVSGRGVGMDVVRANIEKIGGFISLENNPGRGLKIVLRVPLTLTIIPGLIIHAGGQQFAIPRAAVIEILHDTNEMLSIDHVAGATIATIRQVRHSMVDLEEILGLQRPVAAGPRTIMVVRSAAGVPYALGVTSVDNHEELVIRPAAPVIMASGLYAGMTLPDNGQPMLLLDAGGLAAVARLSMVADDNPADAVAAEIDALEVVSALRFREFGGEERLLRLSMIERVEDLPADHFGISGGQAFVRVDDRLVPVANGMHSFDAPLVTALRLRDGEEECCYPVAQVMDIVDMPVVPEMQMTGGVISGVTVVGGTHLEILDPFALFAGVSRNAVAAATARAQCWIAADDDAWAHDILTPLLRQAGYDVVSGDTAPEGAIRIGCEKSAGETDIRLRRASQAAGPEDDSIHYYDRDRLLAALQTRTANSGPAKTAKAKTAIAKTAIAKTAIGSRR